jgi:hypothetical protein
MTRTTTRSLAALALVPLALLVACGGDDGGEDTASDATGSDATEQEAPAEEPAEDRAAGYAAEGGGGVDLSDPDVAAVAEAWTTVFDSTVPAEDKAPFLEDPAGVADTLAAYAATGETLQGITLEPTGVTVDGDTATVTYDILFAGTSMYQDQTGTVTDMDGTWKVTTEQLCSFMETARTPCA